MLSSEDHETLRRLALRDEETVERAMSGNPNDHAHLDARSVVLIRPACLVAIEPAGQSIQSAISECHATGVECGEMLDLFTALTPVVGSLRVEEASLSLTTALGPCE